LRACDAADRRFVLKRMASPASRSTQSRQRMDSLLSAFPRCFPDEPLSPAWRWVKMPKVGFALWKKAVISDQLDNANKGIHSPLRTAREPPLRKLPVRTSDSEVTVGIGFESTLDNLRYNVASDGTEH